MPMKTAIIIVCSLVGISAFAGILAPVPAAGGFGIASVMALTALFTTVGYRLTENDDNEDDQE